MKRHTAIVFAVALLVGALLGSAATVTLSSAPGKPIRRMMLFNFKPDTTPAQIQEALNGHKADVSSNKGVGNIVVGPQINKGGKFQYGISMDFDDEAALKRYSDSDTHHKTHSAYIGLVESATVLDLQGQ